MIACESSLALKIRRHDTFESERSKAGRKRFFSPTEKQFLVKHPIEDEEVAIDVKGERRLWRFVYLDGSVMEITIVTDFYSVEGLNVPEGTIHFILSYSCSYATVNCIHEDIPRNSGEKRTAMSLGLDYLNLGITLTLTSHKRL
ncbi:hypothetical protein CEXT_259311 [Caerostris extrusa]|uniref:Uncharacterized protein n=1 Tax=Caerostris extrusa TaxID=172846 RepID=A0AAV4TS33_CAEEX|nr:hypothetical protein CEXT_259311 [Caerostris extrusa]